MGLETDSVAHLWLVGVLRHQLYPQLAKQSLNRTAFAPPQCRVVRGFDYESPNSGDDALCRAGESINLVSMRLS